MVAEVGVAVASMSKGQIHDYLLDGCWRMPLSLAEQDLLWASELGPLGVRNGRWAPLLGRKASLWFDACLADCH
jgi:hypothetical protein